MRRIFLCLLLCAVLATSVSATGITSADYNAMPTLTNIKVPLLAINSADDERNPPQTGVLQAAIKHLPNARVLLIPASDKTRGHGTTGMAKFYAQQLQQFIQSLPRH